MCCLSMRPEAELRTALAEGNVGCRERARVQVAMGASGVADESCAVGVSMSWASGSDWRSGTTACVGATPGVGARSCVGATPGVGIFLGAGTCNFVLSSGEVM